MTGNSPDHNLNTSTGDPVAAAATTRREDTAGRRARRTTRARRIGFIAGGAAVVAVAGSAFVVTTQPAVGEAVGMPSASATSAPALHGTALDRAQADATVHSARAVSVNADDRVDTAGLNHQIYLLASDRTMSGGELRKHIETTVHAASEVSDQSAAAVEHDADERARAAAEQAKAAAEAAAQAKAEQQREAEAQAQAEAQAAKNSPDAAKATASSMAASQYGWGADQFSCLDDLWTKESGWNYKAVNPNGGATGIPQALPGSKMATIAPDWQTNATTQIAWGLQYIKSSYGTPCAAWAHSQATNYY